MSDDNFGRVIACIIGLVLTIAAIYYGNERAQACKAECLATTGMSERLCGRLCRSGR